MSKALEIFSRIWNGLPVAFRTILAWCIGLGLSVLIVLVGWKVGLPWAMEQLSISIKDDLDEQTDEIQDNNIEVFKYMMDTMQTAYDGRLKNYLLQERKYIVDTTLVPMLKNQKQLNTNVAILMENDRTSNAQIRQLPAKFDAQFDRLIDAADPRSQNDFNREMKDMMSDMQHELQEMREENNTGRRTKKKSF